MKTTVSVYDFRDAFHQCGRDKQFSYEALGLLFDFFEQLEEDTGEEFELDPIAVCCDFSEDTPQEIAENYRIDISQAADDEEIAEIVKDYISEHSYYVGETENGSIVYQQF